MLGRPGLLDERAHLIERGGDVLLRHRIGGHAGDMVDSRVFEEVEGLGSGEAAIET
jgi:hypothetical protein